MPYHLPPPVPPTTSSDLPSNRHPHRANPAPAADDQATSADLIGEPVRRTDDDVLSRLTAIDHRLDQVSTQLSTLLSQLDKTCAILETLSMRGST